MSYRTFKRLMGETSLERKCRFLFGGGLLILITGSFYFYGRLTKQLVDKQNIITGRQMVMPIIMKKHWEWSERDTEFIEVVKAMSHELKQVNFADYRYELLNRTAGDPQSTPSDRPAFATSPRSYIANQYSIVYLIRF